MKPCVLTAAMIAIELLARAQNSPSGISRIENIVVIYAENRSFDALYGSFPGANGLSHAKSPAQVDRDGSPFKELPPVWGGLTAAGVTPAVTEAQTAHLPNLPFAIDDPRGFNAPLGVITRDLWHRFYENQMQIDGGKNDRFVAWADSGSLVMGHYDGAKLKMWSIARQYTLADNFFMGAFGGSYLNHIWLICACVPFYPNADQSPAKGSISAVEADGVTLKMAPNSPKSALDGPPKFVRDGLFTPDGYAVNTMAPPYQPSSVRPAEGGNPAWADPSDPRVLPPQTFATIGDRLSAKGVDWAWYSGAWQYALDHRDTGAMPDFQYHHQPFNYFASFAPGTTARARHLRDAGLGDDPATNRLLADIDAGRLPAVTFYKPQGNLNMHAGYADVESGDRHVAAVIEHLQRSPLWPNTVVVMTHDENGGWWDPVAPPTGDRWGPGSRVPALVISPLAKKGYVDHAMYDTTSILRFITRVHGLTPLDGVVARDRAFAARGQTPPGDLTGALDLA